MALNTDLLIRISAQNAAAATLAGLHKDLDGLKTKVLEVGAAFLGAFAVKNTLDAMNSWSEGVRKIQTETGLTAESSSRLNFIAQALGISSEELATSLGRLDKTMFAVAGKAINQDNVFKKWGISLKDASGNVRNVNDILIDAAARVKELGDGAAATAFEMDLFGRSGGKLHELLMRGADGVQALANESDQLGLTLNGQTLEAMRTAAERTRVFGLAVEGAQVTLANLFLPTITAVIQAATKFVAGITNGIKSSQLFAGVLKAVGEVLRRLMGFFKEIADAAGRFLEAIGSKGLIKALQDLAGDIGKAAMKLLSDIGEKLDSFGPAGTLAKDALIAIGGVTVLGAIANAVSAIAGIPAALLKIPPKTLIAIDVILVAEAIHETIETIDLIKSHWEEWRTAVHNGSLANQGDINDIGRTFIRGLVLWGDDFRAFATMVYGAFDATGTAVHKVLQSIGDFFAQIIYDATVKIDQLILKLNSLPLLNLNIPTLPGGANLGGGGGQGGGVTEFVTIPGVGRVSRNEQASAQACEATRGYQWNWQNHDCFYAGSAAGNWGSGGGTRLAAGGIVTSPTLATIGESGPEAVVPLSKGGAFGSINIGPIYVSGNVTENEDELAEKVGDRIMRQLTHSRGVSF